MNRLNRWSQKMFHAPFLNLKCGEKTWSAGIISYSMSWKPTQTTTTRLATSRDSTMLLAWCSASYKTKSRCFGACSTWCRDVGAGAKSTQKVFRNCTSCLLVSKRGWSKSSLRFTSTWIKTTWKFTVCFRLYLWRSSCICLRSIRHPDCLRCLFWTAKWSSSNFCFEWLRWKKKKF